MKADAYALHLSDEFDVTVRCRAHYYQADPPPAWESFDLIHTFEWPQLDLVPDSYRGKLVSGLTMLVCSRGEDGGYHWPVWGDERVTAWASRCDALHANSPAIFEAIAPLHPHVAYLPNGIDADFWARTRDRSMRRITAAHVGKPKEHKGFPLVGQVCAMVEVPVLTAYRTAHNALPPDVVKELYLDSHVYLVYSTRDGTPCTAIEAAACENAIISNDVGNMKEFVLHGVNGLLIQRDPESLAGALAWCRDHPVETVEMGRQARLTVEHGWTWAIQCERVREFWRTVLLAG